MAIDANGNWYPDTDGGMAAYGQNRYNLGGITYGGMTTGQSPVANINGQNVLNGYNFSGVKTPTTQIGLAGNSYIGKNSAGQYTTFNDSNLNTAAPGSITAANIDGISYDGSMASSADKSVWDKTVDAFTPQGAAGTSVGGNMMSAAGTGIGALTGLAGLYYTKKNYDLQKDNQKYLQAREAQSDARKSQFAANAGNGASYNGVTSSVFK